MRTIYILLITLLFSCTCYAQSEHSTATKTILGGIIDLDDIKKGYITVEAHLKAHFYNGNLTSIILVAYRYKDGEIWNEVQALLNGKNWVTINKKVYPIKKLYETMRDDEDSTNSIKQTLKKLKDYFTLILPSNDSNIVLVM